MNAPNSNQNSPFSARMVVLWLLAGVVVVLAGGVCGYLGGTIAGPKLGARAEIIFFPGAGFEQYLSTQSVVARSRAVLAPVAQEFGLTPEDIESDLAVEFPAGSAVMRLEYAAADGSVALARLRVITDRYLEVLSKTEAETNSRHDILVTPYLMSKPLPPRPPQLAAVGAALGLLVTIGAAAVWFRLQLS